MNPNLNELQDALSVANTAKIISSLANDMRTAQESMEVLAQQEAIRKSTLVAGAEASIRQKELLEEQLKSMQKQNKLLCDNYEKLKEMFDAQVQANRDSKDELEQSRRFNRWMMTVSVIAMLAAIASPIVTLLVS